MAKRTELATYVVDVLKLEIVHVKASSKADACRRVDAGEGELVQSHVDEWAAGPRYCRRLEPDGG